MIQHKYNNLHNAYHVTATKDQTTTKKVDMKGYYVDMVTPNIHQHYIEEIKSVNV